MPVWAFLNSGADDRIAHTQHFVLGAFRGLNMGRTREVLDLLSLGKSIEKILQRIQTEDMST